MAIARDAALRGVVDRPRRTWVPLCISFVLVMIDGYDLFMVSFLAPLIAKDLHLDLVSIGSVFAAGLGGSMAGGLLLGSMADRIGRRPMMLVSLALAGVATLLCSHAHSFRAFAGLRFLTGFALGGLLAAIVPLLAEHFTLEKRSAAVTRMFIGYPLGAVVGGAITAVLISHGWRILFLGAGVVTLLLLPIGLLLRETSYPADSPGHEPHRRLRKWSFIDLFTEGRFWVTVIASLAIFCLLLVTYLLNSWTPLIAARSGFGPETAVWCGVLLNLGGVIGALTSTSLVARFGVFKVVTVMVASGSIAVGLLGYLYGSVGALYSGLAVVGLLVIGGQQNSPAISVRLYPQRMRSAGVGWQFAAGRFGSILGPMMGGRLLSANVSVQLLFVLVAIPALVSAGAYAVVGLLSRETPARTPT
jgi:AAHS family 4-hydroxybenzoate transporter-like MFS transporter